QPRSSLCWPFEPGPLPSLNTSSDPLDLDFVTIVLMRSSRNMRRPADRRPPVRLRATVEDLPSKLFYRPRGADRVLVGANRLIVILVLLAALVAACATTGGPGRPMAAAPAPTPGASTVASSPRPLDAPTDCAEFQRMVEATYAFQPSKLSKPEYDVKAKQLDAVWSYAEEHAAVKDCLRRMLEQSHPGSYFPIDGSSLLVKIDPRSASRALQARLWSDANLWTSIRGPGSTRWRTWAPMGSTSRKRV